jgi:hypothetical protein
MTLVVSPDYGVEIPPDVRYMDLRERAEAACQTINLLEEHGLEVNPTEEDRASTTVLVEAYAKDEEKVSRTVTHRRTATLTPAVLIQTNAILKEFGQIVATHAAEIRHLGYKQANVLETENADPRVRLRALELLGKITDVGLFTERKEVTVTHQNTVDIQEKLREKLEKLKTLKQND